MHLRLVREWEKAPRNDLLLQAIDRVTLGADGQDGLFIFLDHEAEALYRVLAPRHFTQTQLHDWIGRLRFDHPYNRRPKSGSRPGLWSWVKWVVFGGEKPKAFTESVGAWRERAGRYIGEQIAALDEPRWLRLQLASLDRVCDQVSRETGQARWVVPVLRWALVQLLTTPAVATATSGSRHTVSDVQHG